MVDEVYAFTYPENLASIKSLKKVGFNLFSNDGGKHCYSYRWRNKIEKEKMIHIGNQKIGLDQKPFVIAEMSGNHNQSLEKALKITEEIAKCGADAIKLQTYTADTLTLDLKDNEFLIKDEKKYLERKDSI